MVDPDMLYRRADLSGIGDAVALWTSNGTAFALLLTDLDGFNVVNEWYSVRGGDWLLERVELALRALDPAAAAFRLSADVFLVLLPTDDIGEARAFAARIRDAVRSIDLLESGEPIGPDDPAPRHLDCSTGIAVWPADVASWPDENRRVLALLVLAEKAALMAKRDGGGRIATAADVGRDPSAGADPLAS